jgi:hypothetical protein
VDAKTSRVSGSIVSWIDIALRKGCEVQKCPRRASVSVQPGSARSTDDEEVAEILSARENGSV